MVPCSSTPRGRRRHGSPVLDEKARDREGRRGVAGRAGMFSFSGMKNPGLIVCRHTAAGTKTIVLADPAGCACLATLANSALHGAIPPRRRNSFEPRETLAARGTLACQRRHAARRCADSPALLSGHAARHPPRPRLDGVSTPRSQDPEKLDPQGFSPTPSPWPERLAFAASDAHRKDR